MESADNSSGAVLRSPVFYNSSFCPNLTDNTSLAEMPCGGVRGLTSRLDDDANPVIIAIVIIALYSVVCMVGLVGNVLVMYIIVR